MNYNVFKIDDPDTWPEINCPLLVWRENHDYPFIYQWDPIAHCFLNDYDTYYPNKCLYAYIGYRPYIERELYPTICMCPEEFICPYGSDDNGYCMFDDKFSCEYMKAKTEYAIGIKRIWQKY